MAEGQTIHVNFGKPMPVFPLDTVALLPQQVLPLHIFEPRYRQMIERVLDGAGQIALATFQGNRWRQEYHGRPPIRPAVCVGQIFQHERLQDGRFNVVVHGVCRARITSEVEDNSILYRQAMLEPIGVVQPEGDVLYGLREELDEMLSDGPLTKFVASESIVEYIRNEDVPIEAVLELISFTMITDKEARYRLLEEGDVAIRSEAVREELGSLSSLIERAFRHDPPDTPKGCSWN